MMDEEKCECGMNIPVGYGYYNYNAKLKCFGCGRINQRTSHNAPKEKQE